MEVIDLKNKIDLSEIENKPVEDNNNEQDIKLPIDDTPYLPPELMLPPSPPPLSPIELKEKRKLINYVKSYFKIYPIQLSEFKDMNFTDKTISELKDLKDEMQRTVSSSKGLKMFNGLLYGGCDILEKGAPRIGYDLTGIKQIVMQNEDVEQCVQEIALEYQQDKNVSAEKRLMLMMLSMCYGVNYINKNKENIKNNIEKDIKTDINNKYSDL